MSKYIYIIVLFLVSAQFAGAQDAVALFHLFSFGEQGEKPGDLNAPMGLDADMNGNIYVADTGNHRIQKFDQSGSLITFNGGFGWGVEQFQRPIDIFIQSGMDVFVADYENNRIERYDKDLHWIHSISSNQREEERFDLQYPVSLTASLHQDLFVIDGEMAKVLKLNAQFEPEMSFGSYDWGEGALYNPKQCIISSDDLIYISDQGRQSIMIFDYFGNYIFEIGADTLNKPTGLDLYQNNILCVAETDPPSFFFFTLKGRRIDCSRLKGFANSFISDIALFGNRLYAADVNRHCIHVFELRVN
jgi:hypothetical protein